MKIVRQDTLDIHYYIRYKYTPISIIVFYNTKDYLRDIMGDVVINMIHKKIWELLFSHEN